MNNFLVIWDKVALDESDIVHPVADPDLELRGGRGFFEMLKQN